MDFLYIGITLVFFLLTWGLLKLCEALGDFESGGKS
jgi:hypothetical protein